MPQRLTTEIIEAAIAGFEQQKVHINGQIAELRAMLPGGTAQDGSKPETTAPKRKRFSAAARRKMAMAQKARWAKIRGESEPAVAANPEPTKPKRRLSAAGRRNIQEALRKRWAQKRAEAAKKSAPARKATVKAPRAKATKRAPVKRAAARKKTAPAPAPTAQAAG